jgi:hypothetical protein
MQGAEGLFDARRKRVNFRENNAIQQNKADWKRLGRRFHDLSEHDEKDIARRNEVEEREKKRMRGAAP